MLNNRRIPLAGGRPAGNGKFGSGQQFQLLVHPTVASVTLPGLSFSDIHGVKSQSVEMLETITPDFAGWLGRGFWKGYVLKIDYQHGRATFYRDHASPSARPAPFLTGETVVARIPYEVRKVPDLPVVGVQIGSVQFDGLFDTGQFGVVWITPEVRAKLVAEGMLTLSRGEDGQGSLTGVRIAGGTPLDLPVQMAEPPFPGAVPLGLTNPNVVSFGYNLLSQYNCVWDFANKTIYLLKRQ